jgi:hypothetical protein
MSHLAVMAVTSHRAYPAARGARWFHTDIAASAVKGAMSARARRNRFAKRRRGRQVL